MPPGEYQERNPRRRSNSSLLAVVAILVVLLGGGFLAWKAISNDAVTETPTPIEDTPVVTDERAEFASTSMRISLKYPQGYTVDDKFANTSVSPTKPILGVKFIIPAQVATGTNLSADSYISIEQLPRANNCTADIYLAANVKAQALTEGGIPYSVATSSDAGAGNVREEIVYALANSKLCTAIRYHIHTTQIGNYPPGSVREYDRAALIAEFDTIRRSLVLQ